MLTLQGALVVESGDVVSGAVIDGQFAFSYGGVWAAIVESGGTLVSAEAISGAIAMDPGAVAIGTVLSGGVMAVEGVASNTLDNGLMAAGLGGVVIDTTVFGELDIVSGGIASNTTVGSGADIFGALSGGTFVVSSGGVTIDTTVSGGTFFLAGGVAAPAAEIRSASEEARKVVSRMIGFRGKRNALPERNPGSALWQ